MEKYIHMPRNKIFLVSGPTDTRNAYTGYRLTFGNANVQLFVWCCKQMPVSEFENLRNGEKRRIRICRIIECAELRNAGRAYRVLLLQITDCITKRTISYSKPELFYYVSS